MKKINIIFEVDDDTDVPTFETHLGKALDNYTESELDKCSAWRLIEKEKGGEKENEKTNKKSS